MHDTLLPLIGRALQGRPQPLEFYLREQSRLPGPRANLELAKDCAHLLAIKVRECPEAVRSLLAYLVSEDRAAVETNTPAEFVVLCGVIALGSCAAVEPRWREEVFALLDERASSRYWRIREGVALAYQELLPAASEETLAHLLQLAREGNCFQQRAAVAAIAEPTLLSGPPLIAAALDIERTVLEQLRQVPPAGRRREDFRALRQALGYALSVVVAAAPTEGFALMCACAAWGDRDVAWILRENLKKKRLARFGEQTEAIARLLTP
jgi:hypothetical protein